MISLDNLKTTLNAIKCLLNDYAKKKDVPTKLPNPKRLNFTGAVKRSYDGSKALTVEIPYSVQSDWNQNDSTALNYIKNRPFYTGEPVETVLVEETTVSFTDAGGLYIAEFPSTFKATIGDTYTVNWDGTEYECVCSVFNSVPVLGNLSIPGAGSDTGEPFVMRVSNGKGLQIHTLDTSASHTISISGFIAQNVQIPDKYISDTFRDVTIAGDPLKWSAADWTKYYDLFQGGKLLKINSHFGSNFEGYALSMFYKARVSSQISVITPTGDFYTLSRNNTTSELYWAPVFQLNKLYFNYQQIGNDPDSINQEEYQRLEVSDGLKFTTKTSAEDPVQRKVVLEGDNVSAFTNDAGYLTLDTLPNPNPLTFTGAVTGSYDGSEPLMVEIPSGGSSVPKPLTYDYMPEGYPSKTVQTTTLMEEQDVAFVSAGMGRYQHGWMPSIFEIVVGQTYIVKWDGTEYECVGVVYDKNSVTIGNMSIVGSGDDTGEPFVCSYVKNEDSNMFATRDTSATHTISVKTTAETVTPMSAEFIPKMNVSAFTNDAGYLTLADIETVESQLVDIPSKLSQLTNDAGYLTLGTLPKYDGSVT